MIKKSHTCPIALYIAVYNSSAMRLYRASVQRGFVRQLLASDNYEIAVACKRPTGHRPHRGLQVTTPAKAGKTSWFLFGTYSVSANNAHAANTTDSTRNGRKSVSRKFRRSAIDYTMTPSPQGPLQV